MILTSPAQIFSALAKGQPVLWSELGSEDWTPLDQKAPLNFADIYTGFLQFKTQDLPVFNLPIEPHVQAKYSIEFVRNEQGFGIYRSGKDKHFYYAIRVNALRPSISDYFANLDLFVINHNGQLEQLDVADVRATKSWLLEGIAKARKAKRSAERNQNLEETGHFASQDYKVWSRKNKRMGVLR